MSFFRYFIKLKIYNLYYAVLFTLLLLFSLIRLTTDKFLTFYLFFESTIILILIKILMFRDKAERLNVVFVMFLYSIISSFPLFIFIIYISNLKGRSYFYILDIRLSYTSLFGLIVLLAFLVKTPIYGLHLWLYFVHVEAPVRGSMFLSGILLKLGCYGFIRLTFFLYNFLINSKIYIIYLGMVGCLIVILRCLCYRDMKILVAASSVAHISLGLAGFFTFRRFGLVGFFYVILGHGFCSPLMFYLVNIIYNRTGRRCFFLNTGYLNSVSILSIIIFVCLFYNIRCPPGLNFFGEFFLFVRLIRMRKFNIFFIFFIPFFRIGYRIYMYTFSQHGTNYNVINKIIYVKIYDIFFSFIYLIPLNIFIFFRVI